MTSIRRAQPHARSIDVLMRPSKGTNSRAPIYALVSALPADIRIRKFSWKRALLGRWDVIHLHWPESTIRASTRWRRWAKYTLFTLLLFRIKLFGKPAVWTVHNESPHERGTSVESRLLTWWEQLTTRRIYLYPSVTPDEEGAVFIPFGDYSHVADQLRHRLDVDRDPHRMLLFGLLRPYKGIEQLLDAFEEVHRADARTSLAIMGRPTDPDYGRAVHELAAAAAGGVEFRAELLEYEELVREIGRSGFVVLPYRRMYNSGAALLALSCGTPILVPSSQTMDDLRSESGPEWVRTYDGELTPEILEDAVRHFQSSEHLRRGREALPLRSWSAVGDQYGHLYREIFSSSTSR
ncbi:glycosyltransferase [Microbacterium sp.]|uniref:glycosyltransferase n=1 Tax=Microbacterium sp. TaxID=51671 RepID=UPI0037C843EA